MRKWEWSRYTVRQLLNALDESDPDDPHAGNIPISSMDDLEALLGRPRA